MSWARTGDGFRLWHGNCLDMLRSMDANSVEALITDPPYGLNTGPVDPAEVLSVWIQGMSADVGGSGFLGRTWDAWVPGPEVWREVLRVLKPGAIGAVFAGDRTVHWMATALLLAGFRLRYQGVWLYWSGTPKGLQLGTMDPEFEGLSTGLKPAHEPFLVVQKPLTEATFVAQERATGTGAFRIDQARFPEGDGLWPGPQTDGTDPDAGHPIGRWPATAIYAPKPSRTEKDAGLDHLDLVTGASRAMHEDPDSYIGLNSAAAGPGRTATPVHNNHPTVKPLAVMGWLVRLLTAKDGTVLDPFMGSGTTGAAARSLGRSFVGADLGGDDGRYIDIAEGRIRHWATRPIPFVQVSGGAAPSNAHPLQVLLPMGHRCDGEHAAPACQSPACWHNDPEEDQVGLF